MSHQANSSPSHPALFRLMVLAWIGMVVVLWLFGLSTTESSKLMIVLSVLAYAASWGPFLIFGAEKRRRRVMRFVLVSMSLLFALTLIEITAIAKVIDYRHVFGKPVQPWENTKNLIDPELIYVHRPHFHATGRIQGGDLHHVGAPVLTDRPMDVRYDANGFRNQADYETADCIVIGDSFVEAGNVLADELLTHHLAENLDITVANLGQAWYGPQQELAVLRRVGVNLNPQVCVWVFFDGNDLGDVWRYRDFVEDWPLVVQNYGSWREWSFTKNALVWMGQAFSDRSNRQPLELSGHFIPADRRIWFGYAGAKLTDKDLEALEVTAETIRQAYELCQQRDIQLVVAFAPMKYRVHAELCRVDNDSPVHQWVVNDLPERLSDVVKSVSEEIGFIDLTADLKHAAKNGQMLHFPDDSHWSPEGHEIVAQTISSSLEGLIVDSNTD